MALDPGCLSPHFLLHAFCGKCRTMALGIYKKLSGWVDTILTQGSSITMPIFRLIFFPWWEKRNCGILMIHFIEGPECLLFFNYKNVQRLESIQRKEGDFFYFLTLHGAIAGEYFSPYYNKHFLSNSEAQKSANLKKNRVTVKSQRWTLRCLFLFDVSTWFSNLLSICAIIVKAIRKSILAAQNFRLQSSLYLLF